MSTVSAATAIVARQGHRKETSHPTCDTCKWWHSEWSSTCTNPKLNQWPVGEDGALGGEPADLTIIQTGPKFGCIHHAPLTRTL